MIISHSRKFIFIKSTKTAGTSLEAALSNFCEGDDVVTPLGDYRHNRDENGDWIHRSMNPGDFAQEEAAASVRKKVGEAVWNGYFKFSIARNPWDRAVSSFSWHKRRDEGPKKRLIHRLGVPFDEFGEMKKAFARFVGSELKTNDRFYLIDDELCVDYVIRYERLSEGFAEVCARIGVPAIELPRLKVGFRKDGGHYSSFFDEECRATVAERHRNDIRLFGYRFEEQ
jgi:hypothetical protein